MLKYIVIMCELFVFSESALLNILHKCNFSDGECKKQLYKSIIRSLASDASNLNMPPLDPIDISGVTITFPDSMELTLSDGLLEGLKDCSFDSIKTSLEKSETVLNATCRINFNGKYKVKGGQDLVEGEGSGNILFDQVKYLICFPFYVTKRDGEIYVICKSNEITRSYELTGNITFVSDDLGLGDKNEKIVSYLNEHSNEMKKVFIPLAIDKGLEFYHEFADKFFSKIPAKNFIDSDLTPYIKN